MAARKPVLAIAIGSAAGLALAWGIFAWPTREATLRLDAVDVERARTALERDARRASDASALPEQGAGMGSQRTPPTTARGAGMGSQRTLPTTARGAGMRLQRIPLSEPAVRELMPLKGKLRAFDPHCYFVYQPHVDQRMPLRDHPQGAFYLRSNSLGLRMDSEVRAQVERRIIVTGDSHLGLGYNADLFPQQLESSLTAAEPERDLQVLHAGHGAYGLYHYVGVLERFLALELAPDLFIVVVFGGNDFSTGSQLKHFFAQEPLERWSASDLKLRRELVKTHASALGQGVMSVQHFKNCPADIAVAAEVARDALLDLRSLCASVESELLVIYLPAPLQTPARAQLESTREAQRAFGQTSADELVLERLADELLAFLATEEIAAIDLRVPFRSATELLYWRRDLHLNSAGHALVSELALDAVRAALLD